MLYQIKGLYLWYHFKPKCKKSESTLQYTIVIFIWIVEGTDIIFVINQVKTTPIMLGNCIVIIQKSETSGQKYCNIVSPFYLENILSSECYLRLLEDHI